MWAGYGSEFFRTIYIYIIQYIIGVICVHYFLYKNQT